MPLREVCNNERDLQEIADAIAKSHKQLLITGAGISTSCGIPDFRSKDGLYSLIPEKVTLPTPPSTPCTPSRKRKAYTTDDDDPPSSQSSIFSSSSYRSSPSSKMRGQDLFDARVFQNTETTTMFYQFIASLRNRINLEVKKTSATHKFVRTLRDGGRLMRCYTQNIDGLEGREGLCMNLSRGKGNKRRFMKKHYESPRPKDVTGTDWDGGCEVVQLHGELSGVRCRMCADVTDWSDEITDIFLKGGAPKCDECALKSEIRVATGKRGLAIGELRPNIVLYGEDHPQNVLLAPLISADAASQPDMLIIMGTSLKVHGLQKLVKDFAKAVHAQKNGRVIFVNRTRPSESTWDGIIDDYVAMDCDDWVADLKTRREDIWLRQGEINLQITKAAARKKKRKFVAGSQDAGTDQSAKRAKFEVRIPAGKLSTPIKTKSQVTVYEDEPTSDGGTIGTKWKTDLKGISEQVREAHSPARPPFSPLSNGARTPGKMRVTPSASKQMSGRPPISPITPAFSLLSSPGRTQKSDVMTPTPRANAKSRLKHIMSMSEDTENDTIDMATSDPDQEYRLMASPRKRLAFVNVDDDTLESRPLYRRTAGELARSLIRSGCR